jgi:hypothetical protein
MTASQIAQPASKPARKPAARPATVNFRKEGLTARYSAQGKKVAWTISRGSEVISFGCNNSPEAAEKQVGLRVQMFARQAREAAVRVEREAKAAKVKAEREAAKAAKAAQSE